MEDVLIRGVSFNKHEAKISVRGVPNRPGIAAGIFKTLADKGINVDMIIQNIGKSTDTDITFTIPRGDVDPAIRALNAAKKKIGFEGISADSHIAKVSVVGIGMRSHAGVAAAMFEVLGKNRINIEMISTSEIKISCVVKRDDAEKAVKLLHDEFKLSGKNHKKK